MNPQFISPRSGATAAQERRAALWLYGFTLYCILCQIALLFESLGRLRLLFRTATFGGSLILLVLLNGRGKRHPAKPWMILALVIVGLEIIHPSTNSFLAGVVHIAFYLAIAAPLFWVTRLDVTARVMRCLLFILWAFHTLSAGVGVLQAHYPGRFQPAVSTVIQDMGERADAYKMQMADGESVWRPMGLTDMPGGAASAGLAAVLYGLGFLLQSKSWMQRVFSIGSLVVGLFCLYIAQVRSLLVMAAICSLTLVTILMWRGEVKRLVGLAIVIPMLVMVTFLWAVSIGGESTLLRVSSLVDGKPADVYYQNRGLFLEYTFVELLPDHPLGAGLARWGVSRGYFGDPYNTASPSIYVEIQWTAWLLDGGLPLMVVYFSAVLIASWVSLRVALSRLPGDLPLWGGVVFALNVGTIAVTFNYPMFMSQGGMEFWQMNGALFCAAVTTQHAVRKRRAAVAAELLSKVETPSQVFAR